MIQRVLTLASYFLRNLVFSLTGLFYITLALVFWKIFFDPMYMTPDVDYYILLISMFGGLSAFLVTVTLAGYAYRAIHYPLLVRLPRRIEYLAAILTSALCFATMLQCLVAVLALYHGPHFIPGKVILMPMVWLPINCVAAMLGLQASNLVTVGWSRVYLYGPLLLCWLGQKINAQATAQFAEQMRNQSSGLAQTLAALSNWLDWFARHGADSVGRWLSIVFWPLQAITDAVRAGFFNPRQALAPIVLILYAILLFAWAVNLFAAKDLYLTE